MSVTDTKAVLMVNDTLIPDIFIVQYMELLSKMATYFYMWIKVLIKNQTFTEDEALKAVPYAEQDSRKALAELMTLGLITKCEDCYKFVDLKKKEVDEYCDCMINRKIDPDTLRLTSDEKVRQELGRRINNEFYSGKMSWSFYALIDRCISEYGFDMNAVYMLFVAGQIKREHYRYPSMYCLAEEWYKLGITTTDKVDKYIKDQEKVEKMKEALGKILRKRLDDFDIQYIEKWVRNYKMSIDVVEYACKVNSYRGTITTSAVDKTLVKYIDNKITTVDEAVVFEEEMHKENKRLSVRKRNKTGTWKRGKDAGLNLDIEVARDSESDKENFSGNDGAVSVNSEAGLDILNMFRDDDEND